MPRNPHAAKPARLLSLELNKAAWSRGFATGVAAGIALGLFALVLWSLG